MNVVGKVGSFITQGVYSVATPFHPFGGAVDIIAVQQQDGSYRSTPWYVRFGKFQGVLRGAEKIVRVEVNGKECNFHMYIDNSGEAYFVREVVPENSGELNGGLLNGDGVKGTEDGGRNDQVDAGTSGKVDSLNRLESYDSSTGEFELQDEHVSLGVDRLDRTESDCDRRFYDFPDDELSEYGSGRYDILDMDIEVESENLNSEVVLVSVDGHILTAPISSSERNTEDVDLHTPQFHLGPSEGTEEFIDGESSWASDYLNNFETSMGRVNSSDVSPRNHGKAGTLLEDNQADENHPSKVEVHQDIEKQVTEEQLSSSNTSPEMNKENVFKSCLELPSLAIQQGGSVSSQEMDSLEVHRVTEESQDKYPQSISVHENQDLQFTISANCNELSSSSSGIPGISPLSDSQVQAESEATDSNGYDARASGCDSMIYNSSYANGKLEKEFDAATSPQGPPSDEIVANNDVECQTTPLSEENESETKRGLEISLCGSLLHSGMGSVGAEEVFDRHRISEEEFKSSAASIVKNENLVVRIQGKYLHWDKAAPIIIGMVAYGMEVSIDSDDAISVEQEAKVKTGEVELGISPTPSGRGWRLWPIPFRRVKTLEHTGSNGDEVFADSESGAQTTPSGGKGSPHKHLMRTNVPTSDQIASLNLKEGQNMVTFISFSRVLGAQKVEAHIYLWRWNAKIVISDVDGTITKSDVLGQFMPLVGKDWTHTGIARLFSAIKENGYQLLFLSARAIVQAYLTKTFLFNLKQDGKTLPNGPVVISPDGLFPSLYREVIRRAPHEFKIACLEDIKSLFPPEYNPFYAGFGNRDTDELSYRKIGIPKGKIFIINPKGEVAINNRIDAKSYTSLHTLVHDMFPPTSLVEQSLTADVHDLQEDYNSWNYWKMPLPDVDG